MSIATDELQRILFDHITDAVVVVEAQRAGFPIVDANPAYRERFAVPGRALVGEPWGAVVPRSEEQGLLDIFARVSTSGEPFQARDFPYRAGGAADELRFWDWQCLPISGDLGLVERLVIILDDVTERQRQRRARQLNRQIVAQAPLGVLVTSGIDHRVALISPRLAQLGDLPAARLSGRPVFAALPVLAGAGLAPPMAEVYASGTPYIAEEYSFRPDGAAEPVDWSLTILPLPGLDGTTEGLMLLVGDLTAQVRARRESAALAAAAQRRAGELEAVVGAIADGVFLLDSAGRILEANSAGMRLLGLTPPVRASRLLEALVALELQWDDGRPLHTGDALCNAAFGGHRAVSDLVLVGALAPGRGRRFLCFCATPIIETGWQIGGAVVVLRDITPQKQAEQEKDAFLSLIAHEVKSPLTAIKGFAQLACRAASDLEGEGSARLARHLRVIDQQVARIGRLVDELSDVNRLRKGTLAIVPVPCDFAAVAAEAVEAQRAATTTHTIELTIADAPLPVHADPARIEQVVANLLLNAVKYSPDHHRIAVTVGRVGQRAHLAVSDRGIGIPPEERGRIFDRFYRASNTDDGGPGGLGLGLFIGHEIVARSGGSLWVESNLGVGSTFHVALPLSIQGEG